MKSPTRALLLTTAFALIANAQPNELFQKAARAYDASHFAEAAAGYDALLQQGQREPQVYFNLGNAEFRAGHSSAAVLAYRRAWHLAPLDADIIANLQFALEQTGALPPATAAWERFLYSLSAQEWRVAALVIFWLVCGAAVLGLLLPARRKIFRNIALFLFAAFVVTLAGVGYWFDLEVRQPEAVVMQPSKTLFAPLPNATEYFALPAGSIVRLEARDGTWWRIRLGTRSGWLPQSNCIAVWNSPAR